jgi:hypothetical protein
LKTSLEEFGGGDQKIDVDGGHRPQSRVPPSSALLIGSIVEIPWLFAWRVSFLRAGFSPLFSSALSSVGSNAKQRRHNPRILGIMAPCGHLLPSGPPHGSPNSNVLAPAARFDPTAFQAVSFQQSIPCLRQ